MSEEIVDIVDRGGNILRQELKTEAHKHGWLHRTVIAGVRAGDSWRLVRQSSSRQDGGQLVSPVGGHITSGETEAEALKRESLEEIGAANIQYERVGEVIFHRQVIGRDENHMFIVYEITTNDPIVLNHEADSIETFTEDQLKARLERKPGDFGDAYYIILEKFYPQYLPKNWAKRWS